MLNWIKSRVAADAQMQTAAQQRDAEPGEIQDSDGDHDALVLLTRDHNQVKALQEQLETLPSHGTGGSATQNVTSQVHCGHDHREAVPA